MASPIPAVDAVTTQTFPSYLRMTADSGTSAVRWAPGERG